MIAKNFDVEVLILNRLGNMNVELNRKRATKRIVYLFLLSLFSTFGL